MRRVVLLAYALVLFTELGQSSLTPLLPTFRSELGLSKVEVGAILSAATFATVIVSIPVGLACDRIGAHRIAVAAGALVSVSFVVQAFAHDFWLLMLGRGLFGVGYGTIWTGALALVTSSVHTRRATALGGAVTMGGLAHLIGPPFAGLTAEHVSRSTPFVILALAAGIATAGLAVVRPSRVFAVERQPLVATLRAARSERTIRDAVALIALLGLVMGVVQLLVPLRLAANGLSPGQIGAVFAGAAAVWTLTSAAVSRAGERAARLLFGGLAVLCLGAVFVLPILAVSTTATVGFLVLRAVCSSSVSTTTYPIGESGARLAGVGSGAVIGLLNVAWGAAGAVGPLAAGGIAQAFGDRWAFATVVGCCALTAAWVLGAVRRAEPATVPA